MGHPGPQTKIIRPNIHFQTHLLNPASLGAFFIFYFANKPWRLYSTLVVKPLPAYPNPYKRRRQLRRGIHSNPSQHKFVAFGAGKYSYSFLISSFHLVG